MLDNAAELFDIVATLGYAVLGAGLVGTGLLAELRSLSTVGGGQLVLGAWLAVIGGVAIAAGVMMYTDKVQSRLGGA